MNPFGYADVGHTVEGGKWWLIGFDTKRIYKSPTNGAVWLGARERLRFRPDEQLSCPRMLGVRKDRWGQDGAFGLVAVDEPGE